MASIKKRQPKAVVVLLWILACLALIFIVLMIWNAVAAKADAAAFPPEGRMVEVNGHRMHVYVTGERESLEQPAVVMISGLGTPSPTADFYPLWSRLGSDYMVAVIERPGYGWSEKTDGERTLTNIVGEDMKALKKAGVSPPYLLVAHSLGGIEAHLFAATYSEDVSGLLLIDSMSPELYLHYGESPVPIMTKLAPPLRTLGLLRLVDAISPKTLQSISYSGRNGLKYLDDHYRALDRAMTLNTAHGKNVREETERRVSNAALADAVTLPENLPVTLIIPQMEASKGQRGYDEYLEIQSRWVAQSRNGKIVDCDSGHYAHQYVPDFVAGLVREVAGSS